MDEDRDGTISAADFVAFFGKMMTKYSSAANRNGIAQANRPKKKVMAYAAMAYVVTACVVMAQVERQTRRRVYDASRWKEHTRGPCTRASSHEAMCAKACRHD